MKQKASRWDFCVWLGRKINQEVVCGSSREGRVEELSLRVEKLVDLRIGEKKDPKMKCCDGKMFL